MFTLAGILLAGLINSVPDMHISEINVYPIKSLKGIALRSSVVEKRGLVMDRRWVLVDSEGKFLTQRELPRMATIRVAMHGDAIDVWTSTAERRRIEPLTEGDRLMTEVWGRAGEAIRYDVETSEWFSDALGDDVELRYMPEDAARPVSPIFDAGGDANSFADGYPLLLIGEASLSDLNRRVAEARADRGVGVSLLMNRFRPNLVVAGSEAYAEDRWRRIKVGDTVFRSTKPCERCVMTTVDQAKGEFDGKEPLKTLATYRKASQVIPDRYESYGMNGNAVCFGQNLIPETVGATVRVGDPLEVLEPF